MLLLVIAAFTFIYTWSNIATAPYERIEQPVINIPGYEDVPEEPEPDDIVEDDPDPADDEPDDDPDPADDNPEPDRVWDDFITLHMDEADIHRGFLLLVNSDHSFTIPNDLGLVNILDAQTTNFRVQHSNSRLAGSIMGPLDEMMAAFLAATGNRSVTIRSAYRNYETQRSILNRYISQMGRREALRWAALPGHSEHHTGLAFDFGIHSGGTVTVFSGGGSTAWFRRNSHSFGFILRYPPNKTSITQTNHEPWHFRYVGFPHSTIMHQNNWVLEEYMELLRTHTLEEPFEFEYEDTLFNIFFIEGTEVRVPLNSEFEISGNNIDGFIVTATMLPYDPDAEIDVYV